MVIPEMEFIFAKFFCIFNDNRRSLTLSNINKKEVPLWISVGFLNSCKKLFVNLITAVMKTEKQFAPLE